MQEKRMETERPNAEMGLKIKELVNVRLTIRQGLESEPKPKNGSSKPLDESYNPTKLNRWVVHSPLFPKRKKKVLIEFTKPTSTIQPGGNLVFGFQGKFKKTGPDHGE